MIQFIIDAIQAEAFNPSTLFLIGTYTIGEFLGVLRLDNIIWGHVRSIYVFKGSQAILVNDYFYDQMDLQTTRNHYLPDCNNQLL